MKILTVEEIKQPQVQGLIHEEPAEKDWIMGAAEQDKTVNIQWESLVPNKDWTPYITEFELQRNSNFDAFNCVTQSAWNMLQCIAKRKYGATLNESKRWTTVKSGTIPRKGNSVTNVVECIRKMGGVPESAYSSMTPTMTENEFYQAIGLTVDALENFLKEGWLFNHEWLPANFQGATMEAIIDNNLDKSPEMVSIEGTYSFDEQGRLKYGGNPYTHEVLVVASKPDCFLVLDSENPQGLMKVRRDYAFSWPKVGYLEKKTLFKLRKEQGADKPAVYLYKTLSDTYSAISDGEEGIKGGDLLKTFSGTYKNAGIEVVPYIDPKKITGIIQNKLKSYEYQTLVNHT